MGRIHENIEEGLPKKEGSDSLWISGGGGGGGEWARGGGGGWGRVDTPMHPMTGI